MSAAFRSMSWDDFMANPSIAEQVLDILKCGPSSDVRKRVSLLGFWCDATSTLLAEVLGTAHGRVVVTYKTGSVTYPSAADAILDISPLTTDDAQTFPLSPTAAGQFDPLTSKLVRTQLDQGTKKITLQHHADIYRIAFGHRESAGEETKAKAQRDRLRATLRFRRENGHSAAMIRSNEEALARAEQRLAAARRDTPRKRHEH